MKKSIIVFYACLMTFFSSLAQVTGIGLGAKHNAVVNYLNGYNFDNQTEQAVMDDLIYNTGKMFDESAFPGGKTGLWQLVQAGWKADYGEGKILSYSAVLDILAAQGSLSPRSAQYLNACFSVLTGSTSYGQFAAELSKLEGSYDISKLPLLEYNIVAGSVDVLKTSAGLWRAVLTAQYGENSTNWKCAALVTTADLKGATGGFLLGKYICEKLGINDPAKCALIGAAIMGGLYSWIEARLKPGGCIFPYPGLPQPFVSGVVGGAVVGAAAGGVVLF